MAFQQLSLIVNKLDKNCTQGSCSLREQWTENPRVGGSIPPLGINYKSTLKERAFIIYTQWNRSHESPTEQGGVANTTFAQKKRFRPFFTS